MFCHSHGVCISGILTAAAPIEPKPCIIAACIHNLGAFVFVVAFYLTILHWPVRDSKGMLQKFIETIYLEPFLIGLIERFCELPLTAIKCDVWSFFYFLPLWPSTLLDLNSWVWAHIIIVIKWKMIFFFDAEIIYLPLCGRSYANQFWWCIAA